LEYLFMSVCLCCCCKILVGSDSAKAPKKIFSDARRKASSHGILRTDGESSTIF